MALRHFLALEDLSRAETEKLLARASELKRWRRAGKRPPLFERKTLAMIFEKSSTRTRVSFEGAMAEGGGKAVFLSSHESQLGRGEPVEDTARVLSEMADAIMVRTFGHDIVERMARHARVPVINGLTNDLHPCQVLADLLTWFEHRGPIAGRRVAWVGDGNNMCNTYMSAARLMDFELRVATPPDYAPRAAVPDGARITLGHDPRVAVQDADLVVTDVWASMGQEEEAAARREAFRAFQVDAALMARAAPDALFMHCLPAHRGEEVAAEVIDHPASVVWDEAGNRLHAQKALLEFLLNLA
ncbi:MAG: ornithine carbamoyltransferase [Gammaproteobacteria bacterium]|nr:ornithine carbamoyltransferase [Gammaproteobacteria bacterium]